MNDSICRQIVELLDAYRDNELSGSEQTQVKNHLDACSNCRKELESINRLINDLQSLPIKTPAVDIVDKLDLSILPLPADNVVPFKKRPWIAIGAVAAVLLIFAVASQKQNEPRLAVNHNQPSPTNPLIAENHKPISVPPARQKETSSPAFSQHTVIPAQKNLPDHSEILVSSAEIAYLADPQDTSLTDTIGIATDEDGLYEIKI
ncbi:MAG: zf-HC2 domain-containing protein [Candidatus Obscuribacterales bacterium]|nr:zf-HC2 domain-containing protein [Candidatus Obscuribacterales bacterium]